VAGPGFRGVTVAEQGSGGASGDRANLSEQGHEVEVMTDGLGLVPLDLRRPYGWQADLSPGRRNGALRTCQVSGLSALPGDL
jgi:hypothetical protein